MFELGVGSFGFRTTFSVSFERVVKLPFGDLTATVPLPTIVPVSRAFFEAEAKVVMTAAGVGSSFEVTVYGLGQDVYGLLVPEQTIVHLSLGYADGPSSEVITGLLTEKRLEADDCWYKAELKGVDYVFDRLLNAKKRVRKPYKGQTASAVAADICELAGVEAQVKADDLAPVSIAFDDHTPLQALRALADRGGYGLQAKDGKVWLGKPADLGVVRQVQPISDGATSRPFTARGATPDAGAVEGQDFRVAGVPELRPYDVVTLGSDPLRIESVTHELTRSGGYVCHGRAVGKDATHADLHKVARPSAAQVARQLADHIGRRDQRRPAVSAGEVSAYTAGKHTATLDVGHAATADMVSPSVEAPLRDDPVSRPDKPIASPFAFHKCGLVVPVYPLMRAVLVHGWHAPDDAIAAGFLWTSEMKPPENQPGDWWLCLPTQFDGDGLPKGPGSNDLITKDGQRVIQVKGLRITIGAGLLEAVGKRPTPLEDESLVIETAEGAKVTVKGKELVLTDGKVKLTISNGKVNISS